MDWRLAALAWVASWSVVALAAVALDKRAAKRGARRTPEATLLGLALVGGSPGLALGMLAFRHKTRKASFLASFAFVLIAQAVAVALAFRSLA